MTRARHQKGCLKLITRKNGPKVWVFRWRETAADGRRVGKKLVIGSARDLPNEKAARNQLEALGININLDLSDGVRPPQLFSELVQHYRATELAAENEHKAYSTKECYESNLMNWILPRWGNYPLSRFANGIAVQIEQWLSTVQVARGTKAKIRNVMSAVCSHAIRYGWMKDNPIRAVRQSAKRERIPTTLTTAELRALLNQLQFRDRVLVLLLVSTGMRRGELLALQWSDVDFLSGTLSIRKSIWHQHLGPVKTEESEKTMPLDEEMVADLERWREQTAYAGDSDWIFASDRKRGRQPLWPEAIMRQRIIPAARRAGITRPLNWHVFRHTLSTLLVANGEDIKTVQSLLRHASPDVTLGMYTHGVNSRKREAQNKVVEMIRPLKAVSIVALAAGTA